MDMVGTGGEQDSFSSLTVKVLIKNFILCIFHLCSMACQDYFTHFERSQLEDGAKMANP